MNKNILGMQLLMLLLLLPGVFASFSIANYSVSPVQVKPGEFGTVNIIVTNQDISNSAEGIKIEITPGSYITMEREIAVGDLSEGAALTLSIPFKVEGWAPTGIYPINLDIYGQVAKSSGGMESVHKKVLATIKVVNPPALQLSMERSQISEVGEETITVKNNGGTAKKVYISIANSGIGFLNQDVIYIDRLDDNASIPVTIDARSAEEGAQKIQFTLAYEDELGNSYSETRSLPISIRKESGDFVFTQEGSVVTGRSDTLKIEVKNEGDDVQNLRFSTADANFQLVGISEFKVGDLKRGETKAVEVPVLAALEPGSKSISLNLKWIENSENREGEKSMPLKVSSNADVGVYFEAKPAPLYIDGEHTISVTVSNLGSYPIEATTTTFNSEAFELLSIQPEQYIGGLNKDDFSSVQYKVRVKNVLPGTYPMSITVKYRDASGEWATKNVTANVNVLNQPAKNNINIESVLVAVVIIGAVAYWFFIRKKGMSG